VSRSLLDHRAERELKDSWTSVTVQFEHVLARIASGCPHQNGERVVDRRSVAVNDSAAIESMGRPRALTTADEYAFPDCGSGGTADPDNADCSGPRGRSNGGYGIFDIHERAAGLTLRLPCAGRHPGFLRAACLRE
jgi:hypothetical protein